MLGRISERNPATQHGDRAATGSQRTPVCRSVYAAGQPAYNRKSCACQFFRQVLCDEATGRRRTASTHYRYGEFVRFVKHARNVQ